MKTKLTVCSLLLASALAMALPASANVLAQRNCTPDDIYLNNPQSTVCVWSDKKEESISITFHGAPNAISARVKCNFFPAPGTADKIVAISGTKGAEDNIKNKNINGNLISFNLSGIPSNGSNANVLFSVNSDFNTQDRMVCAVDKVS